jgi:hypothetical protein
MGRRVAGMRGGSGWPHCADYYRGHRRNNHRLQSGFRYAGEVSLRGRRTAINIDTNIATSTTGNESGIYSIRFLQIGRFEIVFGSPGFR